MSSPRDSAAAEVQASQARLYNNMSEVVIPNLRKGLSTVMSELSGASQIDPMYNAAQERNRSLATQSNFTAQEAMKYHSNAWGMGGTPSTVSKGLGLEASHAIKTDMENMARGLEYERQNAKLQRYNQLLGLLGGGYNTAMNLGNQATQIQMGGVGMTSGTNPALGLFGGAASGALSGIGGGPVGIAGGAILGGLSGYLGSR